MKSLLFSGLLLAATAASAEAPTASATHNAASDPNEMVCRTSGELGSRLNRRRVCMTRAQWAERQREQRQDIERAQTWRPSPSGGE
jgi:hypothetical protein